MTADDYKKARIALGLPLQDWLNELGISESSHKKYSSGHREVPPTVANLIRALLRIKELDVARRNI